MANNTTLKTHSIQIIPDGSTDWTMGTDTDFTKAFVTSVQFIPSAASDRLIIHEDGIDDAAFFDSGPAAGTTPIFEQMGGPPWPYVKLVIDASDCTMGTPASCKILINIA